MLGATDLTAADANACCSHPQSTQTTAHCAELTTCFNNRALGALLQLGNYLFTFFDCSSVSKEDEICASQLNNASSLLHLRMRILMAMHAAVLAVMVMVVIVRVVRRQCGGQVRGRGGG